MFDSPAVCTPALSGSRGRDKRKQRALSYEQYVCWNFQKTTGERHSGGHTVLPVFRCTISI